MKKLIIMSAMAVFLSSMATQAQSTISWNFNTAGNTEGWHPVDDGWNSLVNGIEVTNGYDSVVLTSPGVTGIDPGIETTNTVSVPAGEYWDTVKFRSRTIDGSSPDTFNLASVIMVIGEVVITTGFDKTDEVDE